LFDAATLQPLAPPISLNRWSAASFSPDERRLLVNTSRVDRARWQHKRDEEIARLYDARQTAEMTQEQLSYASGVDRTYIS